MKQATILIILILGALPDFALAGPGGGHGGGGPKLWEAKQNSQSLHQSQTHSHERLPHDRPHISIPVQGRELN